MVYDVIVIGAGVIGASTAYHLARDGQSVALIEQFPWPHTRGSSHGHSRQLRKHYVPRLQHHSILTSVSRARWRSMERETGLQIYRETGVINLAVDAKKLDDVERALDDNSIPFTPMTMAEVSRKFPMLKMLPTARASLDKEAGILLADNALNAFMMLFKRHGGELRDREEVLSITPGHVIAVQTSKAVHQTRKLVITAGPWAPKVLKPLGLQLPLRPVGVVHRYWREKTKGLFSGDHMPAFRCIDGIDGDKILSVFPSIEYPGFVKIGIHHTHGQSLDIDPDRRDSIQPPASTMQSASEFIRKYLPDVEDTPSVLESCIYTMTPDAEFILDRHPDWNNIVIGAGFSGHGFKMSPVIGEILSDITQDKIPKYSVEPFKLRRFQESSKL